MRILIKIYNFVPFPLSDTLPYQEPKHQFQPNVHITFRIYKFFLFSTQKHENFERIIDNIIIRADASHHYLQVLLANSTKKACAVSAIGFTQKCHTLYLYHNRFGRKFQRFFVTESFSSPAQGRQSQWAWTGNRSYRFPRPCGDLHQRRSPSWQELVSPPRQGFPVLGCGV